MSGAYGGGMLALDLDRRVAALARLAAEYRYLPGLRLTTAQAARLCGLSIREVDVVLTALVVSGHLYCDSSGQYAVAHPDGPDLTGAAVALSRWETRH
jgi:hypothetical protein